MIGLSGGKITEVIPIKNENKNTYVCFKLKFNIFLLFYFFGAGRLNETLNM